MTPGRRTAQAFGWTEHAGGAGVVVLLIDPVDRSTAHPIMLAGPPSTSATQAAKG